MIARTTSTTIITSTTAYFPLIFKPVPVPTLNPITRLDGVNRWLVSWQEGVPEITGYELQEDSDEHFTSPTTFDVGTDLSHVFNPAASTDHKYCYRVRAKVNDVVSDWSSVLCVYGDYHDGFGSNTTGWSIRRQDTDDVENFSYYEDGNFITKIKGRWDYAVSSPLAVAPQLPYRITTRALLGDGVDNLHSYGIIFGGDWNGQPCPASDYSSCFNHYYRLNIIYFGDNARELRMQLKRIDYHDMEEGNAGRGKSLIDFNDVSVSDPSGWNVWAVVVSADGTIEIYVNGKRVGIAHDTRYIHEKYFGVFASTDEYAGTAATFDYYEVRGLP